MANPHPEIVKQFASSFSRFDTAGLKKILAPAGEFIIQDQDGEDLLVEDRESYLAWLGERFAEYQSDPMGKKKLKYEFDTCGGCSAGCPVIYFEGALFPRISDDPEEVLMHGIMLDVKNSLVVRILFCYNFKYLDRYA